MFRSEQVCTGVESKLNRPNCAKATQYFGF
jgi:hypothetical protein